MAHRKRAYKFSLLFILALAVYYSFYFECYLPKHKKRYTSDFMDVKCYFLGAVCFYILNLPLRKKSQLYK